MIAGLLFMAGMRRSEVSALRWTDVVESIDGDGMLVTAGARRIRRARLNDVRFVKDGVARALRTLRAATSPELGDRVVPLSAQMVGFAVHGNGGGRRRREPSDCALRAGRAGVGAHEPGRVDHRRDARRELEDPKDGRTLQRRRDR